eukprot:COSAG06_NODE_5710_length_3310_cov_2107.199626_3_plen_78_part_00
MGGLPAARNRGRRAGCGRAARARGALRAPGGRSVAVARGGGALRALKEARRREDGAAPRHVGRLELRGRFAEFSSGD